MGKVYAYTKASDICMLWQFGSGAEAGAAGSCAAADRGSKTGVGLATPSIGGSESRVITLIPDGVQSITFTHTDGSRVDVPVHDNALVYKDTNLVRMDYDTQNAGHQRIQVPGITRQRAEQMRNHK